MDKPLAGVRVLEIAQFTFVPSAGALLADWGADVIKVENPVTGDAQRNLFTAWHSESSEQSSPFRPHVEAPNRGKRSIGLGLTSPLARPILEALLRRSDVILTNHLPVVRSKLRIDVNDVRRINPEAICPRFSKVRSRRHRAGSLWWRRASMRPSSTTSSQVRLMD